MIIDKDGNVSIVTPGATLDVDGNVNVSGDYRIGGVSILKSLTGGNLFVGEGAGVSNTIGNENITNATAIGNNACVSKSNSLVLGNNVNVGIGTDAPIYTLDIRGTIAAPQYLVTTDTGTHDLLVLIMHLQQEVEMLKKELNLIAEK